MAISIGVIGLGKIAQDQHLPCIAKNSDFKLAAVVSSRPSDLGVPAFKTPAEMLKDSQTRRGRHLHAAFRAAQHCA